MACRVAMGVLDEDRRRHPGEDSTPRHVRAATRPTDGHASERAAIMDLDSSALPTPLENPGGTPRTGRIPRMTEAELFPQICEYLDFIFPDDGDGPCWSQEPYRNDLFRLFAASHDSCHLHGDQLWSYLQDQ